MNSVNILQWNVRSLPARSPSIQQLLTSSKCSIALISETWLLPSRKLNIPHFNLFRADRPDGYGGAAIATHSSLKVRPIEIDQNLKLAFSTNKIDILGIEVLNLKNFPSISLWSCYIPGDSHIPPGLWNSLFQLGTGNFFICGDFNCHHQAWGSSYSSRRGSMIYDTINSQGLNVLNTGAATHLGRPNCPDSAIDISFCSPNLNWLTTWHTMTEPHGSDHFPILISLNLAKRTHHNFQNVQNTSTPLTQFNLNKADWDLFSQTIKNNLFSIDESICPIESYNQFTQMILNSAKQSIAQKSNKKNFAPSPPWWDTSCTQAVKLRKNLFKIFRRTGLPSDFYNYSNACATTTRLLKNKKKTAWKQVCSNLNPSSPLQYLWNTAKRFRNCIQPPIRPLNDDWFDDFSSKVAPSYAPSETESSPHLLSNTPSFPSDHCLNLPLTHNELTFAINSRKSIASGLDQISPLMLKYLPEASIELLLSILNNLIKAHKLPLSWTEFKVIPIPKAHSNISFRPIALSSTLCKLVEHIFKNRFDWWLESKSILPNNLFAFRRGRGTIDCLANFIGQIYQAFNNKEFFVATFIDIRGAFDSVHIPLLLSQLESLNLPPNFINLISLLFSKRQLHFFSPFGSTNVRSTTTGLPQGSCLSPILFNLYMCSIIEHLNTMGHKCLVYADDIVIFSHNRHLDTAITSMNTALESLNEALTSSYFSIAHNKCKAIIFTRRRFDYCPDIIINDTIIPIVTNHTYLGINLDSKLRWAPHINVLTKFCARWSNLLRSVANTWWGSHPTSLLTIYKSVIRSKLDYGCFFSGSSAFSHRSKLNQLQTSCIRSILGALKSTPLPILEVEAVCQPLNLRSKWLAGKFLLKDISNHHPNIYNIFIDVFFSWRYVTKSIPVLASIAHSLMSSSNYIIKVDKLPLYEANFASLLFSPIINCDKNFLCHSIDFLKASSSNTVNGLFQEYIQNTFPLFILIYTDGSVSPISAGYSFFIPELCISFTNNLPPTASSYTAECFAIIESLQLISTLQPNKFLIATDSLSCLQSLSSYIFKSPSSSLIFLIRNLLFSLKEKGFEIQFLWIPGHTGITGNETADSLAKNTASIRIPSNNLIPWSDFCPKLKSCIHRLWSDSYNNLPPHFATWYRNLNPNIPPNPWFHKLNLSRKVICSFSRLRFGHTLLPSHSFKLSLNDSPLCTFDHTPAICDINHILFNCPALHSERLILFSLLHSLNIPLNSFHILTSQSKTTIHATIAFILNSGLLI